MESQGPTSNELIELEIDLELIDVWQRLEEAGSDLVPRELAESLARLAFIKGYRACIGEFRQLRTQRPDPTS